MTIRAVLSVTICVIVSLVLLALATRYLHPHWLFAAVYNLQLHFAAAAIVALLVALLLHRSLPAALLLMIAFLLLGHALFMTRELTAMASEGDVEAPVFRLLSFNLLSTNYENGEAIAGVIAASGADIVNLMEAEPLLAHLGKLESIYPYRVGCGLMIENCDQLMLSKVPLTNISVRSLSPLFRDRFITAEAQIAGHKVNVGGIHTTKPYFDSFQTLELTRAALALTDMDAPLVLSGDLNASSLAPNVRRFLHWTGLRTAAYEPPTWPVRLGVFGLPIDHIYVRPPLKIRSLSRLSSSYGSNHAALVAEIAITGHR